MRALSRALVVTALAVTTIGGFAQAGHRSPSQLERLVSRIALYPREIDAARFGRPPVEVHHHRRSPGSHRRGS